LNPPFSTRLLDWFATDGRHDLPWQQPRTPYRVWVSEIMLQQTQVATVSGYFKRFIQVLPSLPELAAAPLDQVLALWSGLGYYGRARNLHRAAQWCNQHHHGELPTDAETLAALPGIGRSTAAAILALAHGQRLAILDGNVKRVLCRHMGLAGDPSSPVIERRLWFEAETCLSTIRGNANRVADYTQAIMDLGAGVCTRSRPRCGVCPVAADCVALQTGQTANLPTRKARPPKPEKSVRVLLAVNTEGRVLLEKRPPIGIWGGLWSLPEIPMDALTCLLELDFPESPIATSLGLHIRASTQLPTRRHSFTHFRLILHPLLAFVQTRPRSVNESTDQRWLDPAALDDYGIPAPIRKLIAAQDFD